MSIKDILQRKKINSNINPIARMGVPVRSNYSRAAETIKDPTEDWGLLGTAGNIAAGLTAGLKSGLGFYGAMQDARNQQAYNDYLAKQAEQERQDKLEQQAWEQDYKDRALAQDLEKAQLAIDADTRRAEIARGYALEDAERRRTQEVADAELKRKQAIEDRNAQYQHELAVYNRNHENQLQDALNAENRKQAYEQEQMAVKQLDPANQQKYYELKNQGQTPVIIDNKVGWVGKIFGKPKYRISVADAVKKGKGYSSTEADIMSKGLK